MGGGMKVEQNRPFFEVESVVEPLQKLESFFMFALYRVKKMYLS